MELTTIILLNPNSFMFNMAAIFARDCPLRSSLWSSMLPVIPLMMCVIDLPALVP